MRSEFEPDPARAAARSAPSAPVHRGLGNDYSAIVEAAQRAARTNAHANDAISVLIPVYDRRDMLARTLAALTHQTHPRDRIQVIVADDGSHDGVEEVVDRYREVFDLAYVRQPDRGYRLAEVRNLGTRAAKHDGIVLLDADVIPVRGLIDAFARILHVCDNAVLLGLRRFVDASGLSERQILADPGAAERLPDIASANEVHARYRRAGASIDWRLLEYEKTEQLKRSVHPYRCLVGAVAAYPRALSDAVGGYCEEFHAWGGEDAEFGYRVHGIGAYFIPVPQAIGLHQEPKHETSVATDRVAGKERTNPLMAQKVPLAKWRKDHGRGYEVPKLTLALEAAKLRDVRRALDELSDQSFQDFEVVLRGATGRWRDSLAEHIEARGLRVRWLPGETPLREAFAGSTSLYLARLREGLRLHAGALEEAVAVLDGVDAGALSDCEDLDRSRFTIVRKRDWSRIREPAALAAEDPFTGIADVATVLPLDLPRQAY